MKFTVTDEVLNLGIKVNIVTIKGMKNTSESSEFEKYKKEVIEDIKKKLTTESISNDSILKC
jgi:hypothetical protein